MGGQLFGNGFKTFNSFSLPATCATYRVYSFHQIYSHVKALLSLQRSHLTFEHSEAEGDKM